MMVCNWSNPIFMGFWLLFFASFFRWPSFSVICINKFLTILNWLLPKWWELRSKNYKLSAADFNDYSGFLIDCWSNDHKWTLLIFTNGRLFSSKEGYSIFFRSGCWDLRSIVLSIEPMPSADLIICLNFHHDLSIKTIKYDKTLAIKEFFSLTKREM